MKYYIALFQKIKEYHKTQSSNENEIPLICPSLRVYDNSEMELLLPQMLIKEELKGEGLLKKQDLSFQLNSLPSSEKFWDINPSNTLFDVYNKIIKTKQEVSINENTAEIEQAEKMLYANGKPTKEKKAYDKYLGLIDKLLEEWQEHLSKYNDLQTDPEKEAWLEKLNLILLKKEKLMVDHKLLGHKKNIETALDKINKMDGFDIFLKNLENSRNIMEVTEKTGIQSLESYHDLSFVPYDFMSNDSGWVKLFLNKKELDELYEAAKTQKHEFPEEILSIDYDEKHITGIELEFSIVTMQRSWFSLPTLTSDYFKWQNDTPISDGQTISNDFLLSAYTKKLMIFKNLKINIDPTINAAAVNNINQLIHFGPIIMKNQLFINSNNNIRFIKAIKNKETLDSANIKYYSRKMAAAAPAPATPVVAAPVVAAPVAAVISPRVMTMRADAVAAPVAEPPKPVRPIIAGTGILHINPILFQPVIVTNTSLTQIILNVTDSVSKLPVYKSEISIIGTNNNVFKEIESDEKGTIEFQLPVGNYTIKIKKDGYKIYEGELKIENSNPVSKEFLLVPQSVTYDSFFLIGMICEKLPQIPKLQ